MVFDAQAPFFRLRLSCGLTGGQLLRVCPGIFTPEAPLTDPCLTSPPVTRLGPPVKVCNLLLTARLLCSS